MRMKDKKKTKNNLEILNTQRYRLFFLCCRTYRRRSWISGKSLIIRIDEIYCIICASTIVSHQTAVIIRATI